MVTIRPHFMTCSQAPAFLPGNSRGSVGCAPPGVSPSRPITCLGPAAAPVPLQSSLLLLDQPLWWMSLWSPYSQSHNKAVVILKSVSGFSCSVTRGTRPWSSRTSTTSCPHGPQPPRLSWLPPGEGWAWREICNWLYLLLIKGDCAVTPTGEMHKVCFRTFSIPVQPDASELKRGVSSPEAPKV